MSDKRTALILVDLQNDFCPGGALAVREGDETVYASNELRAKGDFDLVIATQDWHPQSHGSFASNHPGRKPFEVGELGGMPQVLWPDHCVQGTKGADFHPALDLHGVTIFRKGTHVDVDSYSGFYDNGRQWGTGLTKFLRRHGITSVTVMGLATDYCVKFTAIDAIREGFETRVLKRGCRGVDVNPGDSEKAFREMADAGVILI